MMKLAPLIILFGVLLPLPAAVKGTFTIGAVDTTTKRQGGAGSSCVRDKSLYAETYFSIPGEAVLFAQGSLYNRDHVLQKAGELMEEGAAPEEVISTITDPSFDGGEFLAGYPLLYQLRQYGMIDSQGRTAGYSGSGLDELYESNLINVFGSDQSHTSGKVGEALTYTAQGNIVTNDTVALLESTFVNSMGCGIADRLMEAVEAVSISGNGDMRCTNASKTNWVEKSIPGASAYIHVENADGTVLVHIDVVGNGTFNPLETLREKYDEWRLTNACGNETFSPPIELTGPTTLQSTSAATSSILLLGLLSSGFIGLLLLA